MRTQTNILYVERQREKDTEARSQQPVYLERSPETKRNGPVPSAREREGTGPNDAARSKGRNVRY